MFLDRYDLGNHGENHKNISQLSDGECEKELMSYYINYEGRQIENFILLDADFVGENF